MYLLFLNVCRLSSLSLLTLIAPSRSLISFIRGLSILLVVHRNNFCFGWSYFIPFLIYLYSGFLLFPWGFVPSFLRWVLPFKFQPFPFSNRSITCHKPPIQSCFTYLPQFLICETSNLIQWKVFYNFHYEERYFLNFQIYGAFEMISLVWPLVHLCCGKKYTLPNFRLVNFWDYSFCKYFMCLEKETHAIEDLVFYKTPLVKFLNHILIEYLLACSTSYRRMCLKNLPL